MNIKYFNNDKLARAEVNAKENGTEVFDEYKKLGGAYEEYEAVEEKKKRKPRKQNDPLRFFEQR